MDLKFCDFSGQAQRDRSLEIPKEIKSSQISLKLSNYI